MTSKHAGEDTRDANMRSLEQLVEAENRAYQPLRAAAASMAACLGADLKPKNSIVHIGESWGGVWVVEWMVCEISKRSGHAYEHVECCASLLISINGDRILRFYGYGDGLKGRGVSLGEAGWSVAQIASEIQEHYDKYLAALKAKTKSANCESKIVKRNS